VYDKGEDDRLDADAPSLADIVVVRGIGLLHRMFEITYALAKVIVNRFGAWSCANIRCDDSDRHDTENF